MKTVGLITEYNPFHNGHQYHIEQSKKITGADTVIVVMCGDYVQRGIPAIMPKHLRAEVALHAGASIIIELPVCYACGSAEYFATGAVSLLNSLGCVDSICFGSECGDLETMDILARTLVEEPATYQELLKSHLKKGNPFPLARQKALKEYLQDDSLDAVLEQPNNILGIEYLKALKLLHSSITPYTIKRKVSGYHDNELSDTFSSASAIRKLLAFSGNAIHLESNTIYDEPELSDVLARLEGQVPTVCIKLLEENHRIRYPIYSNDFSMVLKYKLLSETKESLQEYLDITPDLANRILNLRNDFITFDQFCDLLKTRELTYSRISRSLLHLLLDIKKEHLDDYKAFGYHQYIHLLGFVKEQTPLLSLINDTSTLPLITKLTDVDKLSESGIEMLRRDIYAADLYESVITDKFKFPFISEYQQQLIKTSR
ncbi:MAG: nucleotidyltransferase [Lachnospiraceae bacterium]